MNKRGPSKKAIISTESPDGWVYELYPSNRTYRIYLINPEGRRFECLSFLVEDGRVRNLQDSKMPKDFTDFSLDREDFTDPFIQQAFRAAQLHNVMES